MKLTRLIAIAVISASTGLAALQVGAQIPEQQPAEFPPASYSGKQYVDSLGCVFIRAGIDGNISWVPRVTRSRKTVCGFKPSLSGQVASAPAAAKPAQAPLQITLNNAPVAAPAAVPAPRKVAQRKPQPAPVVVRQTAPKPQPRVVRKPVVVAAPAPAPAPAPVPQVQRSTRTASSCTGASALSQQYLRGSARTPVRCGPQAAPIVGTGYVVAAAPRAAVPQTAQPQKRSYAGYAGASDGVTAHTRIVPKHVAQNRINTFNNVSVPDGYKTVWDDGRLNPKRAEQNLAGRSDMLLIWTQTVPRHLINQATGRDVTASVPLVYPYLDLATQRRELGEVTIVQRDGQLAKRIIRNPGVASRKVANRQPVYSTRSAPKAKQPQAAASTPSQALAGKRYVQVGTYANAANAQAAAQKVVRLGMPARIGKHRKGGKSYMTVQAGPFNGSKAMQAAMGRLRGAGYRDAFARN